MNGKKRPAWQPAASGHTRFAVSETARHLRHPRRIVSLTSGRYRISSSWAHRWGPSHARDDHDK